MSISLRQFPTLETERLILRQMTDQDASDLFAYYSNRDVSKYLDWFGPESEEHAKKLIAYWCEQYQEDTFMRFGIALKDDNKIIGTIPINPVRGPFRWMLPIVLGYDLSRDYWNQGIMTEALEAVIGYILKHWAIIA